MTFSSLLWIFFPLFFVYHYTVVVAISLWCLAVLTNLKPQTSNWISDICKIIQKDQSLIHIQFRLYTIESIHVDKRLSCMNMKRFLVGDLLKWFETLKIGKSCSKTTLIFRELLTFYYCQAQQKPKPSLAVLVL